MSEVKTPEVMAVTPAPTPKGYLILKNNKTVAYVNGDGLSTEENKTNADLFAEAGTVATECGLTLRQLLDQRNEMLEDLEAWMQIHLELLRSGIEINKILSDKIMNTAIRTRESIKKAKGE